MRNILNLFVFAVMALFTQAAVAHSRDFSPDMYGSWQVERPLADNAFVYSTGEINFTEDTITFVATCSYVNGPELKAQVSSPLEYHHGSFTVMQSQHGVTRSGNANCVADLTAGSIEFVYDSTDRLVIFNRHTGFRMDLTR